MDLVESGENYVLRADLLGLSEADGSIELENNVLTISGERKAQREDRDEGYYRVERGSGVFSRSLTLSPPTRSPAGAEAASRSGREPDRQVRVRQADLAASGCPASVISSGLQAAPAGSSRLSALREDRARS